VETLLEAGIFEHGHRLSAVIDDHPPALEFAPGEAGIGLAAGQKEAVPFIDLGKVQGWWRFALPQRGEALRGCGWGAVGLVFYQPGDGGFAGRGNRVAGGEALGLEKAGGHGGNERRIKRRKARELDVD